MLFRSDSTVVNQSKRYKLSMSTDNMVEERKDAMESTLLNVRRPDRILQGPRFRQAVVCENINTNE